MQQGNIFQDEMPVCLLVVTADAAKKKITIDNNDSTVSEITDLFSARPEAVKQSTGESCTSSPYIGDVQRQPVFGGVNWQIQYKSEACSLSSSASKARSLNREWILSCCLNPWIASYLPANIPTPNTTRANLQGNKMARWSHKTVISQEAVFEIGSKMSSKKVQKFINVEKVWKWPFIWWRFFWTIYQEFLCAVGAEQAPLPPETRASFGVLGAISPLPLSSLAVTAKSLLWKSGLSDQHWSNHNGEVVVVVVVAVRGGGGALLSVTLHKAATASTRLIGLKSQLHHFCKESTRSPTHGKTTVRWYSQPTTPWELAVSCASGDQRTGNWICFPPKLLIIEVTLMWKGHFSQVTLIHLLSPCLFPFVESL